MTIHDRRFCTVAGTLSAGGICSHLISKETEDMTFEQYIEFLEPHSEHPDPMDPSKTIPAHGPAICMSSEDFQGLKTELEVACRELGPKCSYQTRMLLQALP